MALPILVVTQIVRKMSHGISVNRASLLKTTKSSWVDAVEAEGGGDVGAGGVVVAGDAV